MAEAACGDPLTFAWRATISGPLQAEARRSAWRNTTSSSSAADRAATTPRIRAGQLGLKVACVEKRATLGGTCLNVGCIPSKALLHASELYEMAGQGFRRLGIEVTPKLNLPAMMAQKDGSVSQLTKGVEFLFKKNKVDWMKGAGKIAGPGKVEVTGEDGAVTTLETANIVIATGSEPAPLPGVAVDQQAHRRFHRRARPAGGPEDA